MVVDEASVAADTEPSVSGERSRNDARDDDQREYSASEDPGEWGANSLLPPLDATFIPSPPSCKRSGSDLAGHVRTRGAPHQQPVP